MSSYKPLGGHSDSLLSLSLSHNELFKELNWLEKEWRMNFLFRKYLNFTKRVSE